MTERAGYRLKPKVYNLKFEDHPGFEMLARSVSVGELLAIMKLTASLGKETTEAQVAELFDRFGNQLVGWNLEDEDGKKIPATPEGLRSIGDFGFALQLVTAWVGALTGAETPTPAANGTRPDPVEASIPMTPATGR